MEAIRHHRHGILLVVILLAFAAQSFGHTLFGGPIATDILTTVLVVVVLLAVFKRGTERVASLVAAAVAVAATLTHYIDLPEAWRTSIAVAQHSGYIAFTGFAVILILRRIFQQTQIRTDDVLGALCGYLLAGAAWANIYLVCYLLSPESFSVAPVISDQMATWHSRNAVFNLLSLGSLTSVGYGEITAIKPPATIFNMLESVFGQFYIAVVVAQLVGLRMAHATSRRS